MCVIKNKKATKTHELDRFGPSARRNTLLLWSVGLYWLSYDIACLWRGALPALYSLGGRVTSWLDLGDNRKVITDYRNHGIIHILTDLIVSVYTKIWKESHRDSKAPRIMSSRNQLHADWNQLIWMQKLESAFFR